MIRTPTITARTSRPSASRWSRAMCAAAVACTLLVLPAAAQVIPKELPPPIRGLEVTDHLGKQVPLHLQFTDTTGKIVSLGDYFNKPTLGGAGKGKKPVVVQLMYYRCPILCPTVLTKFTETLNQISLTVGTDFDALIVSIDPKDTPRDSALKKSAQLTSYDRPMSESVRSGWNFLTSSAESARALADALGFPYRYLPESDQYSHPAAIFVLTPEGKVSRSFIGLNYPAGDVKLALLEASGGQIGSWKDSFVLWCYHYDPSSGTYTLAAMRVMRAGGLASMLFIGGVIAAMWRVERRKRTRTADVQRREGAEGRAVPGAPAGASQPLHLRTSSLAGPTS